ncbi:MAG: NAD(P)H-dependent oxidoreductase subunit E [Bacteroidales bacterium]|nr:NAD(P)H-dependent oxidoreductase subunit E [Bacteroidales bacterium]MBN2755626.1 NAD(P)H-dependent oxidoreductase subunit E [Bacteroidales bacterium]
MAEVKELVKKLVEKHGRERQNLIPILQGIHLENNFLSKEAMLEVAKQLDIASAEVYGTASFYSFLDTEADGKYKIRVCKSITCDMKGKNEILKTMEDMLRIKVGETTEGKRFSLIETNCIGLCDKGPAMLINDEYYTELTPSKVRKILGDYIRNEY